jgi:hypothetical protein
MTLSQASRFAFAEGLSTCRLLNGMWQVIGDCGDEYR